MSEALTDCERLVLDRLQADLDAMDEPKRKTVLETEDELSAEQDFRRKPDPFDPG